MSPKDTTIVCVPGAYHLPTGYDPVVSHLRKAGYNTTQVRTPSVLGDGRPPIQSIDPDVEEVRKQVLAAIEAGQKVVVVMHSYGGVCGSQALEGLDQATLASQGHKDGRGVIHLVYLCAFLLQNGQDLIQAAEKPNTWTHQLEDGSAFPNDGAYQFYNDFEPEHDVDKWVAALQPWSPLTCMSKVTHEPWKVIPTTYLACEKDHAIEPYLQRKMVCKAIEAGAKDLRCITWNTGHTPFGVRPLETSQLIRAALGDVDV